MRVISTKNKGQLVLASLILFVLKCVSNTQAEVNKDFDIPFTLNDIDSEMETLTGKCNNRFNNLQVESRD